MNKEEQLDGIKQKTGIQDFEKVTKSQFQNLQELAAQHEISKEQMRLLIDVIPDFIQLQQTYVEGLKTTINGAKESQKIALDGISRSLESLTNLLNNIVDKAETEELRSKIADITMKLADYGLKIAEILKETNKDNNDTWKYIASGMSACLVLAGAIFFGKK